ncbi:MAG: BrnA antitoxin family protein [Ruminococcus sp.]|nr:BrnA antitoxin family protein [Ruminococcus sp.]
MKEEYDFSNGIKNPYAEKLKQQTTINVDNSIVEYFKSMAKTTGIPYQMLINLYLSDCVKNKRSLDISWR